MTATSPPPLPNDAAFEAAIESAAALLGLPIEPDWRADVLVHLKTITAAALFVEAYPMPEESEPAPVFTA